MRLFKSFYLKLLLLAILLAGSAVTYAKSGSITMSVEAVASASAAAIGQPATSTPATAAGGTAAASVQKTQSVPACQPSNYSGPSAPAAVASQPGLHQNILAPSYYTVYGNTTDQVRRQIAACSPANSGGERFAASTDYALNWAFDFASGDDGLCRVTAASVALNVSVVYPSWQPSSGAAAGLDASWRKFITSLSAHENGHVQINQAGAAQLLAGLQGFPATSCDTIVAQVTAKATADIQAINQSNDRYDSNTGHGATQGAVLN